MITMRTISRTVSLALAAIASALSAQAGPFEPNKFLQSASALGAIGIATSQLNGCEEDLVFSESKRKEPDGAIITVTVTCNRFLDDQGNANRAGVSIEMELNEDGSVGAPLAFIYD